jgi:ribonucleoside-diphosphate reductase beta chain
MSLIGKTSPEDVNLHPIRYQWAYDLYNQAVRNTWFPHEIALKEDLEDFAKMTEDERHAVEFIMSFFNPAELIVNRTLALGVYPYIKSPEAHLYIAKQMWEEANHCVAFEYVLETFPFDRNKVYNTHLELPSMKAKEAYIMRYLKRMTEDRLDIETLEGKKDFIRNLVAYNVVMEGVWFSQIKKLRSLSPRK